MSLTTIKPFFRTRLNELGLKEHKDVFNLDNIPSSLLDGSYHIAMGDAQGVQTTASDVVINQSAEVRFFFKGFRNVEEADIKARQKANEVISSVCFVGNHSTTIKGVYLDSFICEPFENDQNDNVVVGILTFSVRTHICIF